MSGVTKHIYDRDISDIIQMWSAELKSIEDLFPKGYSEEDILETIKTYYPHEWESTVFKYDYYKKKDRGLISRHKKLRYKMPRPEILIKTVPEFRKITSESFRLSYDSNYDETICERNREVLWQKRAPKIKKIDDKIERAKLKTQIVTPDFIDQMIGLYNRISTSQKDKVYILAELKKYYNDKVISFFFKVNDTELNRQLREEAFYHLQSFNYQPRLRRQKYMQVHTKNKKRREYLKKVYPYEEFHIAHDPNELEYRIYNSKEQKLKTYDLFISHSSKDSALVQELIIYENRNGKYIYCDWLNDSDYLKRNLLCDATLRDLELNLDKAKAVIFVDSDNSRNSVWCRYELNYFNELHRPMYRIDADAIMHGSFESECMDDEDWYLDKDYRQTIDFLLPSSQHDIL